MRIGVDIGGTHTDAVLVDQEDRILFAVKVTTTGDISVGFFNALTRLLEHSSPEEITGVYLGTTHATNALLEKRELFRVGILRIAGQRPDSLPAGSAWPKDLKETVIGEVETVGGGYECSGEPLTPFCPEETRAAIKRLLGKSVEAIAIIGVFSPLNGAQEQEAANIVRELAGESFPVSMSHEIGGMGFIERENSTILNASLKKVMQKGFSSLKAACQTLGLNCPLMITQNDGSLMEISRAIEYPILTISAGPTNSFIGGSRLAGLENAIVVDIGGTSTDVGLVRRGFPIRSLNKSNIGGVSLNFPMPDVLSLALGGGSIIQLDQPSIGPQSVGKSLTLRAKSFGGEDLTLTDVALLMGHIKIPEARALQIPPDQGVNIFEQVEQKINSAIVQMQGEHKDLPVVLVGGGAALLSPAFFQERNQKPSYYDVANAYGAALAEISGTVDTVVSLKNRSEALAELYMQARQRAIEQGADPSSLHLVDQQIFPYAYIPNQMARVLVRFCGKRTLPK